jgi:(3R)-3-hydroxyacyl-CoA dehydrogenase / 3a,7a,12a-trihydroxy-5b-cholest-24-enoyl-CoA hydratase / enoyl-CoA hydratase 2
MTDGSKVEENKSIEQVQSIGQTFSYSFKDTILYALSIRMTVKEDLKFLYENHDEFSVFPTFGVIPAQDSIFSNISNFELPQGVSIDPTRLLHGEHYLELYKPLAPGANLRRDYKLIDVLDKGSGASLIFNGQNIY